MKAKKSLGQNFLQDEGVILNIVRLIDPQADEDIIEIGPGQGAITDHLKASGARLRLIELDTDLIPKLQSRYAAAGNVQIDHMDALQLQLTGPPVKVVGNLPYNISSPLLINMLYQSEQVSKMVFMLQKEVVQRICAEPGQKLFGRLSVMLQHRFACSAHLHIPPEAFIPQPKVDSQIVVMTPKPQPAAVDLPTLEALVKQAFAMRRKTIRNNLKKIIGVEQLEAVGIDPGQRPETISLQAFEALAQSLPQQS
jgi:16S rRNA (adenine1518-N6/adenine1519-N6)-dimethyltransferase